MMNIVYNIEPTLLDSEAIEELLHDSEYGKILEKKETTYKEDYIKFLKRSNTFSDEKFKLSDKPIKEKPSTHSDINTDKSAYKMIAGIIVLSIVIGLFFYVKKRYKKLTEDDLTKIENNIQFDFFGEMRQKAAVKNILIASEFIIYLAAFLIIIYILKNILKSTAEIF